MKSKIFPKMVKFDSETSKPNSFEFENYGFHEDESPSRLNFYPFTIAQSDTLKTHKSLSYNIDKPQTSAELNLNGSNFVLRKRRQSSLPKSSWWMWNQNRRIYMNTMNNEKCNPELDQIPKHIVKARIESAVFKMDENNANKRGTNSRSTYETARKQHEKSHILHKLSFENQKRLLKYWNSRTFNILRWIGSLISIISFGIELSFIVMNDWVNCYQNEMNYTLGLWRICSQNTCSIMLTRLTSNSLDKQFVLQTVSGVLISSIVLNFIGVLLCLLGLFSGQLRKRIFMFHSAGEMVLLSGLSCLLGILLYPTGLEMLLGIKVLKFYYVYYMGWTAAILSLISSVILQFDDLIREFWRPRKLTKKIKFH